jgi:hypothetical protein
VEKEGEMIMLSKEKEFPPAKPPNKSFKTAEIEKAVGKAMRHYSEVELPKIEKKYRPASGETMSIKINE